MVGDLKQIPATNRIGPSSAGLTHKGGSCQRKSTGSPGGQGNSVHSQPSDSKALSFLCNPVKRDINGQVHHPGTLSRGQRHREPAVCCYRGEEAAWHIPVPVEGQAEENGGPKCSTSLCAEVVHGHCTSTSLCFLYFLTFVLFH